MCCIMLHDMFEHCWNSEGAGKEYSNLVLIFWNISETFGPLLFIQILAEIRKGEAKKNIWMGSWYRVNEIYQLTILEKAKKQLEDEKEKESQGKIESQKQVEKLERELAYEKRAKARAHDRIDELNDLVRKGSKKHSVYMITNTTTTTKTKNIAHNSSKSDGTDATLIVKANIGGVLCNVLLDTGASTNLLGAGWLDKAKSKSVTPMWLKDGTRVTGAKSNQPLKTLETTSLCTILIGVEGKGIATVQYIATPEYEGDAIIGYPTLELWEMSLHMRQSGTYMLFSRFPELKLEHDKGLSWQETLRLDNRTVRQLIVSREEKEVKSMLTTEERDTIMRQFPWMEDKEISEYGKGDMPKLSAVNKQMMACVSAKRNSLLYEMIDRLTGIPVVIKTERGMYMSGPISDILRARQWREKIKDLWGMMKSNKASPEPKKYQTRRLQSWLGMSIVW